MMDFFLGLNIEYLIDFFVCFIWHLRLYESYPIHHAVNMGIDSDECSIIEDREYDFGSLDSYSRERLYQSEIIG
jgi:hypothetical protein